MDKIGSELAEELRDVRCAVFDDSGVSARKCGNLLDRAARFVDGALNLGGCPRSGHAYIRVSCAHQLVFVEVTHLGPGTFGAVTVDEVAVATLDALRTWTLGIGRSFSVERGPRDQLRISVVLEPDADGQDAPRFSRHTDTTV